MACANGVSALTIPWTNISVQASSNVPVRGLGFGVGTPTQSLSFWPSLIENETFVPNPNDCNNLISNLSCIAVDGGIYYTSNSSTYKFASQSSWNGSQTLSGIHTYLNDNLQVASDAVIWGMPLVQRVINFDFQGALGLGASSSFLKSLVNQTLAPSRNFGIWSGSLAVDDPVDGSLIIGGFDASKVGSLTNFSSVPGCVACAVVSGLELNLSNGTAISLLTTRVPQFNIVIDPYYVANGDPVLAVPDEIRDVLSDATQAVDFADAGARGWLNGEQPGDVGITFSNGYQVTIPGNEIWLPPRGVNSEGQAIIQNNTEILNGLRAFGPYDPATYYPWGQPFLSTNYMIVWPDDGVWSLSPISSAQRTSTSDVQNLCDDVVPSAPSPTTTGTSDSGSSSGSHAGAIAGGVVGGVLGLAILLAAFWFFRRRAKRRAVSSISSATELQNTDTASAQDSKSGAYYKKPLSHYFDGGNDQATPELAAHERPGHTPAEMPGSPNRVWELPDNQLRR